jgi:hypothetical protein
VLAWHSHADPSRSGLLQSAILRVTASSSLQSSADGERAHLGSMPDARQRGILPPVVGGGSGPQAGLRTRSGPGAIVGAPAPAVAEIVDRERDQPADGRVLARVQVAALHARAS